VVVFCTVFAPPFPILILDVLDPLVGWFVIPPLADSQTRAFFGQHDFLLPSSAPVYGTCFTFARYIRLLFPYLVRPLFPPKLHTAKDSSVSVRPPARCMTLSSRPSELRLDSPPHRSLSLFMFFSAVCLFQGPRSVEGVCSSLFPPRSRHSPSNVFRCGTCVQIT